MGKYIRGNVDEGLALGTLAALTLVGSDFDEVVNGRTLVSSIVTRWTVENWTAIAQSGPLLFGVAHGDYSDAEIEEYLEATQSWNEGDLLAQEVSKRKIRRIGVITAPPTAAESAVFNEGRAKKTKLNWILNDGETMKLWAYNTGSAALATTAPVMRTSGHANLWPR